MSLEGKKCPKFSGDATGGISLSYKATQDNPWDKVKNQIGKEVKIKINNITDKAIFGELTDLKRSGMLH